MSYAITGRPIVQKADSYRSKRLTDLARDIPCQFTFAHECKGATMACHANWLRWSKGVGLKAPDWAWASGCLTAHNAIDDKLDRTLSMGAREAEWMNAFIATHNYLWKHALVRIA